VKGGEEVDEAEAAHRASREPGLRQRAQGRHGWSSQLESTATSTGRRRGRGPRGACSGPRGGPSPEEAAQRSRRAAHALGDVSEGSVLPNSSVNSASARRPRPPARGRSRGRSAGGDTPRPSVRGREAFSSHFTASFGMPFSRSRCRACSRTRGAGFRPSPRAGTRRSPRPRGPSPCRRCRGVAGLVVFPAELFSKPFWNSRKMSASAASPRSCPRTVPASGPRRLRERGRPSSEARSKARSRGRLLDGRPRGPTSDRAASCLRAVGGAGVRGPPNRKSEPSDRGSSSVAATDRGHGSGEGAIQQDEVLRPRLPPVRAPARRAQVARRRRRPGGPAHRLARSWTMPLASSTNPIET